MNNKSVYKKRIIAFVDILGSSTLVEDPISDTTVRPKLLWATKLVHQIKDRYDENVQIGTFSDSAVISYPLIMHGALFRILVDIIYLQLWLGKLGIMIRSEIVIGDVYYDGDILFRPAMSEAYHWESKVAVYPRIVIEKDTLTRDFKIRNLRSDIDIHTKGVVEETVIYRRHQWKANIEEWH